MSSLDTSQLVQLLLCNLALRDELFSARGNEVVARVYVVVDAVACLLETGCGEDITEEEVAE